MAQVEGSLPTIVTLAGSVLGELTSPQPQRDTQAQPRVGGVGPGRPGQDTGSRSNLAGALFGALEHLPEPEQEHPRHQGERGSEWWC